jgi:hypothetical protein
MFTTRVIQIFELLSINGNTALYKDKQKQLDTEQLHTLKKLKQLQAQSQHKLNKLSGSNKPKPRRSTTNNNNDTILEEVQTETQLIQTLDDTKDETINTPEILDEAQTETQHFLYYYPTLWYNHR